MNWKMLRVALTGMLLAATIGCGGINGSYGVSPASFLLPGLGHVTPTSGATNSPSNTLAAMDAVQ